VQIKSGKLKVSYPTKDELKKALIGVGVGLTISGCGTPSLNSNELNTSNQEQTQQDLPQIDNVEEEIEVGEVVAGTPALPPEEAFNK
jgi:hypothetical protein